MNKGKKIYDSLNKEIITSNILLVADLEEAVKKAYKYTKKERP